MKLDKLDKIEKIFLLFLIITYLIVIFNLGYSSGYNDGALEATIANTKISKAWSKDRI
jgi:cell division protein FtsL